MARPKRQASYFFLQIMGRGRGSSPRPPLEPQFDVVRYSPSWCVRIFGYLMGFR